jgi:hypothetical protein
LTQPPGYRGPHDQGRDSRLCARCGDPIHRLAEHVTPAWLDTLEAVDPEALGLLHAYATQLATLWWWTHQAMDGAARGNGQDEIRTRQRGGDPTAERLAQTQRADGTWSDPDIADRAAVILRGRSRREAKRIRDATTRLRKELDSFATADEANLEVEREQWESNRAMP